METSHVKDAPEPYVELLEGHGRSEVLVRLGDDDVDDELLRETHPELIQLVHLGDLLPTVGIELPFVVRDVPHPPRAHGRLFPPPSIRHGRGGVGVFRSRLVVVVDFDSLAPEFFDGVRPFTHHARNCITVISPAGIGFVANSRSRTLVSTRPGSAIRLARKWRVGGRRHREVELDDVELGAIVDFGDAHDVAPLLLTVDDPLALADDKHLRQLALEVVGPLLPDSGARVEESGLASAEGADAGGEGSSDHGGCGSFLRLADSLVWYLWIPTVEGGQVSKIFFLTHHHNHDKPDRRWAQRY